ncbi:MAG: DNA polymerase IV [Nanoarchaeota archaeon]|nr:DNA polymerase IV [Nanoarchaeota archaeon]
MKRIVALVDLDAFYAQVEELRNPKLKGKAVIVCMYSARGKGSGAVATANYEARKLGVRSGMPIIYAKRKAKNAVFLPADRDYYWKVSARVMDILQTYSDLFEQVSIDEAYLDLSQTNSFTAAERLAKKMKSEILQKEKLTCSIGIGPNKLVAKIAAGVKKPNGLVTVPEDAVPSFLKPLSVGKLYGVGPKTEGLLASLNMRSVKQLKTMSLAHLQKLVGSAKGSMLYNGARGKDDRPVQPGRQKQQVSRLTTMKKDTSSFNSLAETVASLSTLVHDTVSAQKITFQTVSLIVMSNKMEQISRSHSLTEPTTAKKAIQDTVTALLKTFLAERPDFQVRRIGVRVSGLEHAIPDSRKPATNGQRTLRTFRKPS